MTPDEKRLAFGNLLQRTLNVINDHRLAEGVERIPSSAIAQYLEVTPAYISDVVNGRKAPFHADRILAICEFVGASAEQRDALLAAAADYSGAFSLPVVADDDDKNAVAARLSATWAGLDPEAVAKIEAVVD